MNTVSLDIFAWVQFSRFSRFGLLPENYPMRKQNTYAFIKERGVVCLAIIFVKFYSSKNYHVYGT